MDHVSEQELIQWEHLPLERREEIEAHGRECPECHAAWTAQAELWAVMGHWQSPPAPDQSAVIMRRIASSRSTAWNWKPLVGVAAALAISTGLGYTAGIFARPAAPMVEVTPEQAAAVLHLDDWNVNATGELKNLLLSVPEETVREVPG